MFDKSAFRRLPGERGDGGRRGRAAYAFSRNEKMDSVTIKLEASSGKVYAMEWDGELPRSDSEESVEFLRHIKIVGLPYPRKWHGK